MSKSKILKNTTEQIIKINTIGQQVPALGQITVPPDDYDNMSKDSQLLTDIDDGKIVVNDGISDLSINLSKAYITSDIAEYIGFNNNSNGFSSKDVQAVIEELKNTGIGSGGNILWFNDAGTEDKWLQVSEHHSQPSGPFNPNASIPDHNKDIVPYIVPHYMKIFSLTFVNKKDRAESDIEFYKNGNLIFTWQVRNSRWSIKNAGLSALTFVPGDKISMFAKKVVGAIEKPDDLEIFMYYTVTQISTNDFGDSDFVTGN